MEMTFHLLCCYRRGIIDSTWVAGRGSQPCRGIEMAGDVASTNTRRTPRLAIDAAQVAVTRRFYLHRRLTLGDGVPTRVSDPDFLADDARATLESPRNLLAQVVRCALVRVHDVQADLHRAGPAVGTIRDGLAHPVRFRSVSSGTRRCQVRSHMTPTSPPGLTSDTFDIPVRDGAAAVRINNLGQLASNVAVGLRTSRPR